MQYGMEVEFFLTKKGELVFPADYGFEHDGYPILGELRSEPHTDPYKLVGEMMGLLLKAKHKAKWAGLVLHLKPAFILTDVVRSAVMRRPELNKGPVTSLNIYPEGDGILDPSFIHAGIHIHFSGNKRTISHGKCDECNRPTYETAVYAHLPIPEIVKRLDKAFMREIKKTERPMGEYEMKTYGFEYRSLPNNTNLDKIAYVLDQEVANDMLSRK